MSTSTVQVHSYVTKLLALILPGALYLLARLPDIPPSERRRLANDFRFEQTVLPTVPGSEVRFIRPVHPSLRHAAAWISSVGAAVALNDLDGNGRADDVCYVDVRRDQVIVAPAPGTGLRYPPFALDAGSLFTRDSMAPMGCLPGDVNEDGQLDLLVYYWGRTPVAFLKRGSEMTAAAYRPVEIAPGGERWYTNAATFADLDGDGHTDLIVANYFEDGARILDAHASGTEHLQHSMSRAFNGGSKHLMLWNGSSQLFREFSGALPEEAAHGWTLAVGAADLDGDLRPEIYFANDFGPDRLLHNESSPGHLRFRLLHGVKAVGVPNSKVLGRDSFKGMGVDFGDVNGDGWPDIFVSNIAAPYALEESHFLWMSTGKVADMRAGIAPYVDRSESLGLSRSGWGWDARLADFNNDGVPEALQAVGFIRGTANRWPELHEIAMGNDQILSSPQNWHHFTTGDDLSGHEHNPFYARADDGRYYDISREMGAVETHVSRGIAIADVDGDGRLDYVVANQWEDSILYRNVSRHAGAFLGLRIRRNGSPAIGASASVTLPGGRRMQAQVDGGSGHSGKRSPEIHFGLGQVGPSESLAVEIRWRDTGGIHLRTRRLIPGWHTVELEAQDE